MAAPAIHSRTDGRSADNLRPRFGDAQRLVEKRRPAVLRQSEWQNRTASNCHWVVPDWQNYLPAGGGNTATKRFIRLWYVSSADSQGDDLNSAPQDKLIRNGIVRRHCPSPSAAFSQSFPAAHPELWPGVPPVHSGEDWEKWSAMDSMAGAADNYGNRAGKLGSRLAGCAEFSASREGDARATMVDLVRLNQMMMRLMVPKSEFSDLGDYTALCRAVARPALSDILCVISAFTYPCQTAPISIARHCRRARAYARTPRSYTSRLPTLH